MSKHAIPTWPPTPPQRPAGGLRARTRGSDTSYPLEGGVEGELPLKRIIKILYLLLWWYAALAVNTLFAILYLLIARP